VVARALDSLKKPRIGVLQVAAESAAARMRRIKLEANSSILL
jgi:hypothetical protein